MDDNNAVVTIATFDTEFEASLARGALEAIGIRALVPSESQGTFSGLYGRTGLGQAELRVLESDRVQAVAELRRIQFEVHEGNRQSD